MAAEGKPRVLILGGCGFIGRHLVHFLVANNLASFIKVADKNIPALSYLSPAIAESFKAPIIKFQQADLSRADHVQKVFGEEPGFNYVFNLCGETRFGLTEADYKKKTLETAVACGKAAAANKVQKFVEVSSGQVYGGSSDSHDEDAKINPWTMQAAYRYQAEEALRALPGLNLVVLRPAMVYGPGDLTSLTPRLACAAVYQLKKEKMKFMWDDKLQTNTVHVRDMVRAMWHAATQLKPGTVWNVADEGRTTQGTLANIISTLFRIETGFVGTLMSTAAKLHLSGVAEQANEDHVPPWGKLCQDAQIANTPVSPYIDAELLKDNHLAVNGSRLASQGGFKYEVPRIAPDLVREQLDAFIAQGLFPKVV